MMTLKTLTKNIPFTGLSIDSRTLNAGELFFALNPLYIDEAISKGASLILTETLPSKKYEIPIIQVNDLRHQIGYFASEYYDFPSKDFQVIAVTGTNGKTSCSHFIAQAFHQAGFKSGVMGTLGNGMIDHINPGTLTTPDPVNFQKLLSHFKQEKVNYIALEASSHGLDQGRLNGTHIETAIFTNLTRDHLDYHETMENYANAKFRLFEWPSLQHAILNLDDPYGIEFSQKLQKKHPQLKLYGVTLQKKENIHNIPLISADNIKTTAQGFGTELQTPWGKTHLQTSLLGKFNLTNLLCVLTTLNIYGISLEESIAYISRLNTVPGRMETFGGTQGKPLVIVDYSHTPDSLLKALQASREHCKGKLWCVFGCGGDRDKGKRPEMGRITEQYADQLIITDDNPRTENPGKIIADIRAGLRSQKNIMIEHDRRRAIAYALNTAKSEDVILIAGKGHEIYQEIGHQRIPFNDGLTVKLLLLEQG